MKITDAAVECGCGWSGWVGSCEPDVDGDGGLGCPECGELVETEMPSVQFKLNMERLGHLRCSLCGQWWSIGDIPKRRKRWYCTGCGVLGELALEIAEGETPAAAVPEPPPAPGTVDVYPLVIDDIRARVVAGREKYGTVLQTHNGRDALNDLYQELIDAVMYVKQRLIEDEAVHLVPAEEMVQVCRIVNMVQLHQDVFGEPPAGRLCLEVAADRLAQMVTAEKGEDKDEG